MVDIEVLQYRGAPDGLAAQGEQRDHQVLLHKDIPRRYLQGQRASDAISSLNESIYAGVEWKRHYRRTMDAIALFTDDPAKRWNFDIASIFAQVDAFVQRCRDLLEVCEGQMQFARDQKMPVFGGTRGPEVAKQLLDIESEFQKHVARLQKLDYDVLDVKATKWHDDYNQLKNGMKDLEVMMQNVINGAFDSVSTVSAGVELLEIFYGMAKRANIKRCIVRKTADVFTLITREIEDGKARV